MPFRKAQPGKPGLHPLAHGRGEIEPLGDEAPVGRLATLTVPAQAGDDGAEFGDFETGQRHVDAVCRHRPFGVDAHAGLAPPRRAIELALRPVQPRLPLPVGAAARGAGLEAESDILAGNVALPAGEFKAAHIEVEPRLAALDVQADVDFAGWPPAAQALHQRREGNGIDVADGKREEAVARPPGQRERQCRPAAAAFIVAAHLPFGTVQPAPVEEEAGATNAQLAILGAGDAQAAEPYLGLAAPDRIEGDADVVGLEGGVAD
mgnify:CR=1 FL=1